MTQEAIKMGMTAEDLAVIEKAYRENPDDMKARVAYLEAGIREVRARLVSMKDWWQLCFCSKEYSEGVLEGAAFAEFRARQKSRGRDSRRTGYVLATYVALRHLARGGRGYHRAQAKETAGEN